MWYEKCYTNKKFGWLYDSIVPYAFKASFSDGELVFIRADVDPG